MAKKEISRKPVITSLFFMLILLGAIAFTLHLIPNRQQTHSDAATSSCSVLTTQMQIKPEEQEMFSLINAYRATKNIPALTWDTTLKKAAEWMSIDMKETGNTSHTDSLMRTALTRLTSCGYTSQTYGENLGKSNANASNILSSWQTSSANNNVLIDASFKTIGIAMEVDATGANAYWTVEMGTESSVTPTNSVSPTTQLTPGASNNPTIIVSPTLVPSLTVNPTIMTTPEITQPETANMQIIPKVKIQGIGDKGNLYPKRLTRKVQAYVYGASETPVAKGTGYLTYDKSNYFTGTINLGRMAQGIYFVKLVSEGTLTIMVQPEFQHLNIDGPNALPTITLVQGDINGDNTISMDDFNLALACFQDKKCQTKELVDLNDDGLTDVTDYNVLLQSFKQQRGK